LLALMLASPWFFGGVEARYQSAALGILVFCTSVWLLLALCRTRSEAVIPREVFWLALVLLLPLLQLAPLPAWAHRLLSPQEAAWRETLTNDDAGLSASRAWRPISIYPAATRHEMALLAMGVMAFALGTRFFRTPRSQGALLAALAIDAAAMAIFSIVQQRT